MEIRSSGFRCAYGAAGGRGGAAVYRVEGGQDSKIGNLKSVMGRIIVDDHWVLVDVRAFSTVHLEPSPCDL